MKLKATERTGCNSYTKRREKECQSGQWNHLRLRGVKARWKEVKITAAGESGTGNEAYSFISHDHDKTVGNTVFSTF